MVDNYVQISVKPESKEMLRECKKEFLKYHPEFKGKPISFNHILAQVCEFYLRKL